MTTESYRSGYTVNTPRRLVLAQQVPDLDLIWCIGQRTATFKFMLSNGVTGEQLGEIYPLQDTIGNLSHDTTRTIKRELRLSLDASDVAEINVLTDRISPYMVLNGSDWPLGRYQFTGEVDSVSTGGDDAAVTLMDEMYAVDQGLQFGFSATGTTDLAVRSLLDTMSRPPALVEIEASPYAAAGAWSAGTQRGQALDSYATTGDYETAWFDNSTAFRMIRTVDAAAEIPAFNWDDDNYPVLSDQQIARTSNLLSVPNRFLVIGNGQSSTTSEISGFYEVPPSAPHSIANRGFIILATYNMDVATSDQATAAARNLGLRSTVVEQYDVVTPPDPRHDSYDVVRWRAANFLETAWSMDLIEGGDMHHTLRRSYALV